MELFIQQIINGLVIGSTYAVVAIGFALVFSVLKVINFAHPELFMVGSFAGLLAATHVSENIIVVLLAGAVTAAVLGLVMERTVLRYLRGREVLMTLIATVGVAIIIHNAVAIFFTPDPVQFPELLPQERFFFGDVSISIPQIFNFAVCGAILLAASFYVRRTRYGRATRSIAERPDVAAAFGVDVNFVSMVTVVIASAMAGVAAVSVGLLYNSAWAFIGVVYGLKAFVCMLVAGSRFFEGVIVVGLALGVIEALVTGYVSSSLKDAVAFIMLMVILFLRPGGLFGSYQH